MAHSYLLGFSFAFLSRMLFVCALLGFSLFSNAQIFHNKGSNVVVKEDAVVIIKGSARNSGYLGNESKLIIEGDFTNTDTTEGIGVDTFEITGNWTNNGTFIAGQSTVVLPSGNQVIGGTSVTAFYNLTLSGTGVKSLTNDAAVSNHLALNDRELATGTKRISITTANINAISRTSGFVSSLGNGRLERSMDDSLAYLFPLGSSAGTFRYRPLVMEAVDSDSVSVAARFANLDASLEGFDRSIRSDEVCEINPLFYHHIERTQGLLPVNVTMFFDSIADGNWTQIAHWQNIPQWELSGLAAQGFDTIFKTLTVKSLSEFDYSPFALMTPVPILDSTQTVVTNVSCNSGDDGKICVSYPPLTGTAPFQYLWSNGGTDSCITGLTVGGYSLTIIDAFGCSSTYSFSVNEPNNMVITPAVTDVLCKGGSDGSICINVTGDFPPFYFNWSLGGAGDSCLVGLEAGPYRVTITDSTGCPRIFLFDVNEPQLLVATAQGTDVTCFGFDDGQGAVTATGGTEPYSYQWESSSADTLDNVNGLSPGTYEVTVTDEHGCTATTEISISQPDSLIVTAGHDTIIFNGFSANLDVASVSGGKGNVTYQWTPDENVVSPASPATSVQPNETTTYTITITDENGCVAADTLRVQVDINLYTFPDAFVPNGNNHIFLPITSATVAVLKLEIFNRWGQLLSENSSGWDGKFEGKLQPMDTYVYQAVLQLPDGTQKKERGDFILIW